MHGFISHLACLLVILAWVAFLYGCGIWLFASGFLLKRLVIERNSSCGDFGPLARTTSQLQDSILGCHEADEKPQCWSSARFGRAVILLIDGLRHDFAIFDESLRGSSALPYYKNKLVALSEAARRDPRKGLLFRFVADPPTTTLQRLKGLMTGSLPTFIDMSANFASHEISEDSLIRQLHAAGKNITFMGDDTWQGMFPNMFHRAYFYPSFNVKDLHTVDNGILEHLVPEMKKSDWDVLIAHFLGVDHCGHRFGPSHPAMADKLRQMDRMIRDVLENLPEDAILFVFGDHGMTQMGDHGGDSKDEVTSVLFAYSHRGVTSETQADLPSVSQVDFVPTASLLLGVPVPFSSIGSVIEPLFSSEPCPNASPAGIASSLSLLSALRVNVAQVHRYLTLYASASGSFSWEQLLQMNVTLERLEGMWEGVAMAQGDARFQEALADLKQEYSLFLQHIKMLCVQMWTKYDMAAIACGLLVLLLAALFATLVAFVYSSSDAPSIVWRLLVSTSSALSVSLVLHLLGFGVLSSLRDTCLLLVSVASVVSCTWGVSEGPTRFLGSSLSERSTFVGAALQVLHFAAFFSNSFIVYEDRVAPFLLQSMLTVSVLPLLRRKGGPLLASLLLLMACVRLGAAFRKCREEQHPCRSSAFVPPLHSLPPEWHEVRNVRLVASCASLLLLGLLVVAFLKRTGNLGRFSVGGLCVRYLFPCAFLCICLHWTLGLFPQHVLQRHLHHNQEVLAQAALVQLVLALALLWLSPVCCDDPSASKCKYSSSLLVLSSALLGLHVILAGDGMALALVLQALSAFLYLRCLSKILAAHKPQKGKPLFVPWICVSTWEQLSAHGFFSTGHQNSLSAIPWHAAFIGTTGELTNHVIPGIQVLSNIFSSHVLFGVSLPLLLTWCTRSRIRVSGSVIPIMGANADQLPDRDEIVSVGEKKAVQWQLLQMVLQYLMLHGAKLLGTACACAIHRRHLMVWKIFAPRFMFCAVGMCFTVASCILGFLFVVRIDCAIRTARRRTVCPQAFR